MVTAHFGVLSHSQGWLYHSWHVRARSNINYSRSNQVLNGLMAIPAPLAGLEGSRDHALTSRSPHDVSASKGAPGTPWCPTTLRLETLLCKHLSVCSHKPSFLRICKCKATPDMSVQGNKAKQTTCPSSGGKWNQQELSCKGHPLPPTPSSPQHTDFCTALGIYDPYEIQHSCSPHLQQPMQPSFTPAGLRQNPKIMLQTNAEWCSTLLVSSQPTAGSVFFFKKNIYIYIFF